jgi:hypothetical protein
MGIRFFCPNGHKLNVKDFQAGQTGICPVCGVKSPIPLKSTRESSKLNHANRQTKAESSEMIVESSRPPTIKSPLADPLTEAGDAAWYVQPPSGGQFGPAVADVMRTWLAEGRITSDALVWHEGWNNWKPAAEVFPQLSQNQPSLGLDLLPPQPAITPSHPRSALSHRHKPVWDKRLVVGLLAGITFILVVILLVITLNQ